MAKFIYRMQSILDIKSKMEEQAKQEFATARMKLSEEEDKLENLKARHSFYEEEGRRLRAKELKVLDLMENRTAILRMEEYIELQKQEVERAQEVLEQARERLKEAMQESKTQQKLREKAFEQFVKDENVREAKEVDELTSYTHSKKA